MGEMLGASIAPDTSISVVVLVVGTDARARARSLTSLRAQSIPVQLLTDGESLLGGSADVLLLLQAGAQLDPTAAERLAWFLRSRDDVAWASTGSHAAPVPDAVGEAVLTLCAVRTADARAVLDPDLWTQAGADGARTPGLALQLVVALQQQGQRGVVLRQPAIVTHDPSPAWPELVAQGAVTLEALDLTAEACLEREAQQPPLLPLQRLDRSLWPASPAVAERLLASGPRRLLMLLQGFPMGGYTAFNADLIPRLVANGHHVTTACTEWWRTTWRLPQVRAVAPDVHHLPSCVSFAAMPTYLAHLIASRRIDTVLLSHSLLSYRALPLLRAAFPHVAFVDYVHTEWFEPAMYGSYATMSARWTGQLDAQVTSSHALAESLIAQGARPDQVRVAHIGIDTAAWSPDGVDVPGIRTALGAGPDTTLLLFAGRVSPEKRPLLAVDALEVLRGEARDVRLVVAGDGPLLRPLNAQLETRGLAEHATLLGELDEDTLRQIYAACDIVFSPSEIEGVARTLYEAMAMACVPVVSDVGGQRELVDATCGSLVPAPREPDVMPYLPALRAWCEASAREGAGALARARMVEHFDVRRTVRAIEDAMTAAHEARANDARHSIALDDALAEEFAVLGLELMRRHALRAAE